MTTVAKLKLGWRVNPKATALDAGCKNIPNPQFFQTFPQLFYFFLTSEGLTCPRSASDVPCEKKIALAQRHATRVLLYHVRKYVFT